MGSDCQAPAAPAAGPGAAGSERARRAPQGPSGRARAVPPAPPPPAAPAARGPLGLRGTLAQGPVARGRAGAADSRDRRSRLPAGRGLLGGRLSRLHLGQVTPDPATDDHSGVQPGERMRRSCLGQAQLHPGHRALHQPVGPRERVTPGQLDLAGRAGHRGERRAADQHGHPPVHRTRDGARHRLAHHDGEHLGDAASQRAAVTARGRGLPHRPQQIFRRRPRPRHTPAAGHPHGPPARCPEADEPPRRPGRSQNSPSPETPPDERHTHGTVRHQPHAYPDEREVRPEGGRRNRTNEINCTGP